MNHQPRSNIASADAVKAEQPRRGPHPQLEGIEQSRAWPTTITPDLAAMVTTARSFYLGTASAAGQPYIQHRGGPPGFLKILDERTLGFADLTGNRQYITAGNLAENPRAFIFLMDYARRRRVKLWGTAQIVEDDADLLARTCPPGPNAKAERVILFTIETWDRNGPRHIPQLVPIEAAESALRQLRERITELEAELKLRSEPNR